MQWQHPTHQELVACFQRQWEQQGVTTEGLLHALPAQVQQAAIELLAEPYSLGAWDARYEIQVPDPTDHLAGLAFRSVMHLKLRFVQELMATQLNALAGASAEEEGTALQVYQDLQATQTRIARALGIVVFPIPQGPGV